MSTARTSSEEDSNDLFAKFRDAMMQRDIARINEIVTKENVLHSDLSGNTFLHYAAEHGTVEIANQLLILGSNTDIENQTKKTPIFYATKHSFEMVQTLLTKGSIVTSFLIRYALFHGTEDIVRLLFTHFKKNSSPDVISPRIESRNQESNLLAELQDTEALLKALLRDGELSWSYEEIYSLVIFFAAKIGKINVLQLVFNNSQKMRTRLLTIGFNSSGDTGESALHFAVSQQHVDAVRCLLDQGADPNWMSHVGLTPLHYAAVLENYEICQLLLNSGAIVNLNYDNETNPLHLVCGSKLNGRIVEGHTRNTLQMVGMPFYNPSVLLEDVTTANFHEFIIDVFCHFEHQGIFNNEIMKLLLRNGADPERRCSDGILPLMQACQANRLQEVKTLLEFGVDIHNEDYHHNTALHYVAVNNSIQFLDFLLKQNLKINQRNNKGNTPLMFAILENMYIKPSTIKYLVDRGSSLSIRNDNNETALDIAVHYNNPNVVLTLLELGADRSILKCYSNPKIVSFKWKHCPGMMKTRLQFAHDTLQTLISYIMLQGSNVNDYYICCLEPLKNMINFIWNFEKAEFEEFKSMLLEKTKLELEKLKLQKIFMKGGGTGYSYHDFLVRDFATTIRIIKNPTMRLELSNLSKERFPCSYCLLQHRFNLAVDLENCFDNIVNFLSNYGKVRLLIDVIENILSYLSQRDIRIFGQILAEVKY